MRTLSRLLAVLLTAVAATFGLIIATSAPAAACSCAWAGVEQHAKWADAVFTGELAGTPDRTEQTITYTFDVDRVYAGKVARVVDVETGSQGSACGIEDTEAGRTYVVFASGGHAGFSTSACSGTRAAGGTYVDRLERHLGVGTPPSARTVPEPPGNGASGGDGISTGVLVVGGASAAVILAALVVGALRTRRQAGSVS